MLIVIALVTTSPIAYWLLYAIGSVVLLSYFWTRHAIRNIRMRRRLQTKWATVGDLIEEEFELVNTSRLPVLVIEIEDHSELPGYQASVAESLGGLQTKRWRTRGTAGRRGFFSLGPADLRVGDPFGFFTAERRDDRKIDVVVYPPISVMSDVEIPAGAMVGTSRSSIRTHQVTSDAGGIREFQPGDPLKRIHWPSTARRDELLVKEFDLEPTASLWIALDLERSVQAGYGDESTEEYGVKIVSSLAYQLVRDNKSVGFIAHGPGRPVFGRAAEGPEAALAHSGDAGGRAGSRRRGVRRLPDRQCAGARPRREPRRGDAIVRSRLDDRFGPLGPSFDLPPGDWT